MPQGRCHYFINLTLDPMAMLWVYAGDRPDRIVMDETYCHPEKASGVVVGAVGQRRSRGTGYQPLPNAGLAVWMSVSGLLARDLSGRRNQVQKCCQVSRF